MDIAGKFDWDDIRYFLAVARHGSTVAAARQLGVSQTTIARRIDGFERRLGATLFERDPTGYRLTPAGVSAVASAEAVEARVAGVSSLFPSPAEGAPGRLRVTTMETFARYVLLAALEDVRAENPEAAIELIISDAYVDLAGGEADLAFRGGPPPKDPDLVFRRMPGEGPWAFFAHRSYAEAHGMPRTIDELRAHHVLIGTRIATVRPNAWLQSLDVGVVDDPTLTSFPALVARIMAGDCVTLMPNAIAYFEPELVCGFVVERAFPLDFWAVYHGRVKGHPDLRPVIEAAIRRMDALRRLPPADGSEAQP